MSAEQSHLEKARDQWWFLLALALALLGLVLIVVLFQVHLIPMDLKLGLSWLHSTHPK